MDSHAGCKAPDGNRAHSFLRLAQTGLGQIDDVILPIGTRARINRHQNLATHEAPLAELARHLPVSFEGEQVLLSGVNVSETIRTEEAGMNASKVSVLPAVRQALVDLQHSFARLPGLLADGRDMGTVIFPEAALKVFLTASAEKRAERRHKQLISKGFSTTILALRADLEARDARDTQRSVAPLKPAPDAMHLDNSSLSIDDSVAQVLNWWQSKQVFGSGRT